MFKAILGISIGILFVGCSSTTLNESQSNQKTHDLGEDIVLSRIDNMTARPAWLKESESFKVEGGNVISLGSTVIPADHRVEAAYRIAENNAKAAIGSAIEQRLESIFQNAEEGTAMDTTQARYIGAEASKLATSSIRLGNRYWEKVSIQQQSGNRIQQVKVFTTVTMPESDFKEAVMESIKKRTGKGGLSKDFAQKVNDHWDKFTSEQQPK